MVAAAAVLVAVALLGAVQSLPHRILLDTDVDTDDFFALLYLLKLNRSEFDLKVTLCSNNKRKKHNKISLKYCFLSEYSLWVYRLNRIKELVDFPINGIGDSILSPHSVAERENLVCHQASFPITTSG